MSLQCQFFGGTADPARNTECRRPAKTREYGLVVCDLHYDAIHMDPEDWTDEMREPQSADSPQG